MTPRRAFSDKLSDMSAWAARYVRLRDRQADITRLRSRIDDGALLVDDGKSPFAVWLVPTPAFQPDNLAALSRDFGEALSMSVQTVADLVIYDHYVAGAHKRGLTYAGEAGWIRVIGEPEAWESPTLFSAVKLDELTRELEEDVTDDAIELDKAQIEALWKVGRLQEGKTLPHAEPAGLVRAIEKMHKLPSRP
jgi:hypothetical protein